MEKIGMGGSCHWCTEAIFQSIQGVSEVDQGWLSSERFSELSEAVIITFDPSLISLDTLIETHLHTHSCTSIHTMRTKYRSAVYCYSTEQKDRAADILNALQTDFDQKIITEALMATDFKRNKEQYLNYYYDDPSKPFCKNIINPKLRLLLDKFAKHVDKSKFE